MSVNQDKLNEQLLDVIRDDNVAEEVRSKQIKFLLRMGADINCNYVDNSANTPLMVATSLRRSNVVDLLIKKGARLSYGDGCSLLETAIVNNDVDTAEVLLNHNVSANARNKNDYSVIRTAFIQGNVEVFELLLKYGADPNTVVARYYDNPGTTLLMKAAEKGNVELVKILLDYKASVPACDSCNEDIMSYAGAGGKIEIVEMLLERGAVLESKEIGRKRDSVLVKAIKCKHEELANYLIGKGMDVNACDKDGVSLLKLACKRGLGSVVKELLDKGARIEDDGDSLEFPIVSAISNGNLEVVKMLVEKVADVRLFSDEPLIKAVRYKHKDIVKYLIEKGVDVNAKAGANDTPLGIASEQGDLELVKLFLEKGAEVDTKSFIMGKTPLMYACKKGHIEVVKELLNHGADVDIKTDRGVDALGYAEEHGHEEVVSVLKKHIVRKKVRSVARWFGGGRE